MGFWVSGCFEILGWYERPKVWTVQVGLVLMAPNLAPTNPFWVGFGAEAHLKVDEYEPAEAPNRQQVA